MISKLEFGNGFTMGPAGELMQSLWRLNHALERVSRGMEASSGVTAQQRMMIRCIGRYPGMIVSQLAAHFHLDAGTVSSALDRLERKGLLERRRGHRDRRRVTVGLTASGRAIDRKVAGTVEHAAETLLGTVSAEDVARTRGVLWTLADLLEREATELTPPASRGRPRPAPGPGPSAPAA